MTRTLHSPLRRTTAIAATTAALLVAMATLACTDVTNPPPPPPPPPTVARVVVRPATSTLEVGDQQAFTARVLDIDGNDLEGYSVAWSSTSTQVATVSSTGLVTAIGEGTTSIRASAGGRIGAGVLTVRLAPVATLEVSPPEATLAEGGARVLTAVARDAAGRELTGRAVTWASANPSVATVSPSGLVTAVMPGTAIIQAAVESKVAESRITVTAAAVERVELSQAALNLFEGESRILTAVAKDANGRVLPGRPVEWSSTDPSSVSVDALGRVTAIRAGRAEIVATIDSRSATALITVARAPVASISIAPTSAVVEIGEQRQYRAQLKDALGNVLEGRTVTWSVDYPTASITPGGVLTGVRNGYVTVWATSEGVVAGVGATIVMPEPTTHDLVYHRLSGTGASEIFILQPGAGVAPTRLNAGSVSRSPAPSPDGWRVAFAVSMEVLGTGDRIDDIFAVDRDGRNMQRLTSGAGYDDSPAWSPTGGRIAYHHWETGGRSDIWVMNADGTNPVNLTADLHASGFRRAPAWSRDGTRIAFAQSEYGPEGTTASIWIMNADGSHKRRLTSTLTGFDSAPTWSPDGIHLAFSRYYGVHGDITIIDTNTGATSRLALEGLQVGASWSPDGSLIAFTQSGSGNIYTVRPDGTNLRLRTVDPAWGGGLAPAWITRR
ncbi:MAG: Ig-like domain-containing protein [Gemmatimonadaceae bacterium]|nr:Ig-like domain-containing protein [Gemmatimonadaceae bacterium]